MTTLKLGIDEAGRGPVIGPMVVAGALITDKQEKELRRLCVKDSKQVTPKRREFLYQKLIGLIEGFHYVVITPEEIDRALEEGTNLNQVEAIAFSKVINKLNKKDQKLKLYLDCPSVSLVKWEDSLKRILKNLSNLDITCEHKADANYICAAAASIIAKYHREKEMDKLREKYGKEIGSGYTSDPLTRKFLEDNIILLKNEKIFRKSWITYKNALKNSSQGKLF
jgi:ribonuclease HII